MMQFVQQVRDDVAEWAAKGPWPLRTAKTALTHSLVLTLCVLVPAVLGLALVLADLAPPFLAFVLPLVGFGEGYRFYRNRELGPNGDVDTDGIRATIDALLDFFMPIIVGAGLIYLVIIVYSAAVVA